MARAIAAMGFGTELDIIADDLATPRAVKAVAECDVVFGCMDGVEGRHLLNRLAAYYVLPYFDVGMKLEADGQGGVNEACGAVHYVRPDGATLLTGSSTPPSNSRPPACVAPIRKHTASK